MPDAPTGLDLLAVTDSGVSDTDNLTNITELQFQVDGVLSGATIKLLAGDTVIGEGLATGDSIVITNANLSVLGDGEYSITAVQEVGDATSAASAALMVSLDQTAPAAITNAPTTTGMVDEAYQFDAQHEEEGDSGFRYSLANAPSGMAIDEATGEISWTPSDSQSGIQTYTLVVTDAAGNSTDLDVTVDVDARLEIVRFRLETMDLVGNPVRAVGVGATFELLVFVEDTRVTPAGVTDAYLDVVFDSSLASAAGGIVHGSDFPDSQSGTATAGLLDEVGAATSTDLGGGEFLLFSILMNADAEGVLDISTNPADDAGNDVRLSGLSDALTLEQIDFDAASLRILVVGAQLTAEDDSETVQEDSTDVTLDVLANDVLGPDSGSLDIVAVSTPDNGGTVDVADDLSLIYSPAPDFFGDETFTYTIEDAQGNTSTATVTVTVENVNDPPVANDDFFPEDWAPDDFRIPLLVEDGTTPVGLNVLGNDNNGPDPQDDPNEIHFVDSASGAEGTLEIELLGINYTPAPNFFGEDVFTYVIRDQNGATGEATVTVTISEVNDAPTAVADTVSISGSIPVEFDASQFLGNDTAGPREDDVQTLTIVDVQATGRGTVSLAADGSSITYTPPTGFSGTDTFTYTIEDNGTTGGEDDFLRDTVTVTVTSGEGNAPPIAFDDRFTVAADSGVRSLDVLANDTSTDPGETLTIESVTQGSNGGIVDITDGGTRVSYTPMAGFTGTETFRYTINDGNGGTDDAVVTITVSEDTGTMNSSFSGMVFFDTNDNGRMDSREQGIGGVQVLLSGADNAGNEVVRETITARNGSYMFDGLAQGNYVVRQVQPSFLLDGQEVVSADATSPANDELSFSISADGMASAENMFGERGLSPELTIFGALASAEGDGFLTVSQDGRSQWTQIGDGWSQFSSVDVALSDDMSEVVITVVDDSSTTLQATVPTRDKSRVHLLGRDGDATLIRINGASSRFTFTPVSGAGVAAAVDAAFADGA